MDLSEMNKIGKTKVYNINNIILEEQCIDTSIYIVLQGSVDVIENARGFSDNVKVGEYFGGVPVLQDNIRLFTIKATEDNTILFQIEASTYIGLIESCPQIYSKVFISLLNRVRAGIDTLNETDPVSATLYKLNSIYARINLLKDSQLKDMVFEDLNYTVFVMRFLSDLCNKLDLNIITRDA